MLAIYSLLFFFGFYWVFRIFSKKRNPEDPSSSVSSSASSSASDERKVEGAYDVFLSFRGEDTRKCFVSHLYRALVDRGIHTFRDDERLSKGEYTIGPQLLKSIDDSKFAIIVFSKNYAGSSWCLDELVHIVQTQPKIILIPVFYDVTPSDVREPKNDVATALRKLLLKAALNRFWNKALTRAAKILGSDAPSRPEYPDKSVIWKKALTASADIPGWVVANTADGDESECIKRIVTDVFDKLRRTIPNASKYLVGMNRRENEVMKRLRVKESEAVRIVRISGMGGAGKTTLAAYIFDKLSNSYEASCFFQIDAGECRDDEYLKNLQERLLSRILKLDSVHISNIEQGISTIRDKLRYMKKLLLVVDNVNHERQLEALAVKHDTFGIGSRVIITTRDNSLLSYKVDDQYLIELLNEDEGMQLFCLHAFSRGHPPHNLAEYCVRVVKFAGGHPLALKVLGPHLVKLSWKDWSDALDKLKDIPLDDIDSVFKLSYDRLDSSEKRIFRGIACFFKGEEKQTVIKIFDSLKLHSKIGITTLVTRNLVTIEFDPKNKCQIINMHDLIQAMGRNVVRTDYQNSMLWEEEEIVNVLNGEEEGYENIEEIVLKTYNIKDFNIVGEAFRRMKRLKMLSLERVHSDRAPEYLPSALQCIRWNDYPWESLPEKFDGRKLVGLIMHHGRIIQPITGEQRFNNLKIMDLSYCHEINQTPDLSNCPNLEELTMNDCQNLEEVQSSFGVHQKLRVVDLSNCTNLKILPRSLQMESLKRLNLSGCWKLDNFPQIEGDMTALEELNLSHTRVTWTVDFSKVPCLEQLRMQSCWNLVEVHPSIGVHKKLRLVDLNYCSQLRTLPDSLEMESLKFLNLCDCRNLKKFPEVKVNMTALVELDVSGCFEIKGPPNPIRHLTGLRRLNLRFCPRFGISISQSDNVPPPPQSSITAIGVPYRFDESLSRNLFTFPPFGKLTHLSLRTCNLSCIAIPPCCLPSLLNLDLSDNPLQQLLISEDCLFSLRWLDLRVRLMARRDGQLILWSDEDGEVEIRSEDLFDQRHLDLSSMVFLINSSWPFEFISAHESFNAKSRRGVKIHLHWETLSHVLSKRDSRMTIQMLGTEIPEWFGYRIGAFHEVILPPPPTLFDKKFKGLIVCAHCDEFRGQLKLCYQTQKEAYPIESQDLLFCYIPISTRCSSFGTETTYELLQDICLFDAWIECSGRTPVCNVEWGIRLLYEDGVHEENYNEISVKPIPCEQSTAGRLKIFCGERVG